VAESVDVLVIGGGQAGLSTSYELTRAGVEHVVLERGRIGGTWRGRWDSFCLVTPNWSCLLPGHHYDGNDPDGYMHRDEIVAYLERYASGFGAPVREGVEVLSLEALPSQGFRLQTSEGEVRAATVVVGTGAYQKPYRPLGAGTLPEELLQIDVEAYQNPAALPSGRVLLVGSGQSGCQIAEELNEAGREVFLACGRAPWAQRRVGGRDIIWWSIESGFMDMPVGALPSSDARFHANLLNTGHGGGHNLNLRTLRTAGVTLLGHFLDANGNHARFADDLAESVAWGDERNRQFMDMIKKFAAERGLTTPDIVGPASFEGNAPTTLDLSEFGTVIFTGGFRPGYGKWMRVPGAFDDVGLPVHVEGASVAAPDLYFVGVHFLRKRKSSLLCGVGEDAAIVANQIAQRHS
jgi:putative flavoprotein involved in K+ transport